MPLGKVNFKFIKIRKYIFPCILVTFLIFMVIFSESSYKSAHKGFMLWANNVFPSLLPFFICIELIKATNLMELIGKILEPLMRPIFKVPGCGAFAIVMGMSSGYPVGAKIVSNLRESNSCTKTEGERLLSFTNTSGPLFIIGSVGIGMFNDSKIGLLLLSTHFLSSIIVGVFYRFYHSNDEIISQSSAKANSKEAFKISALGNLMGNAIKNGISTLLIVCGYMIFFSVLGNILISTKIATHFSLVISFILSILGFSPETATAIFSGILEVTGGISELSKIDLQQPEILSLVAFILGFGGLSVCMQVSSIISNTDLSLKPYIIGKFMQAIFASVLTFFIVKYTDFLNWKSIETLSYGSNKISESSNILIISITTLLLITIVINQITRLMRKRKA